MAYSNGILYILVDDETLLKWYPKENRWESEWVPRKSEVVGLRAVNRGKYQSHVILYANWSDTVGGDQSFMILGSGEVWANGDGEGTVYDAIYGSIQLTLPPLSTPPGFDAWIQEVWINGSWAVHATPAYQPIMYLSATANYSDGSLGTARSGGRGMQAPPDVADAALGQKTYMQLTATHAKDIVIESVKFIYTLRGRRVAAF